MESVQFGILENVGSRAKVEGEKDQKTAECEQGTIYDAYVNSENIGDTPCSCHTIAGEKEQWTRDERREQLVRASTWAPRGALAVSSER